MKNNRMGALVTSVLLMAGMASVTGCSTASESGKSSGSAGSERVAFLGLAAQNTYTQSVYNAAKKVIEGDGGSVTYFDGQFKSDVQYNQMLDVAASGRYDAALVMANDGAAIAPAVEKAIAAGIKVIAVEFPIGPDPKNLDPQIDGLLSTVGYDAVGESVTWANRVVDACKGKDPCNVAWLMGDRTTLFDRLRWDAITTTVAEHPNVKIVTAVDMHWNRTEALAAAKTILTAHPDDLHVITGADIGLMGATDALSETGDLDRYTLIGFGTTVDGISQVRKGVWDSSAGVHQPADAGALASQMVLDALAGKTIATTVNMVNESPIGPVATKESLAKDPSFVGQWN